MNEDVSFRIASREWLVNKGWLSEAQAANNAMYVKEFEIFLPTVTGDSVRYTTTSKISGRSGKRSAVNIPEKNKNA